VVKFPALRVLLSLANSLDLEVHQIDVKTAFLHGELEEEIFMEQPEGFSTGDGRVCQLKKALYGLKQASRAWNLRFKRLLLKLGYVQSLVDPCVYVLRDASGNVARIVAVWVDDCVLLTRGHEEMKICKKEIAEEFEISDDGELHFFLGLQVIRDRVAGVLRVHQQRYIESMLEVFGMRGCNSVQTPQDVNVRLTKKMSPVTEEETEEMASVPFRKLIGCLLYASVTTRPDIELKLN